MADLRGRLVILDFWTGCCVNCLNVLQTLRRITAAFADAVLVIGVHSPKFPHEREPQAVAHAIDRHDIRHPVVHDPNMLLWSAYGVRGWPTLVFIGPDGKVLGDLPGEPDCEKLLCGIGQMVHGWRCGRHDAPAPLPMREGASPGNNPGASRLRYPTKIKPLAAPGGRQWVCADSGHHQVVVLDDEGRELRRFGCGRPGFIDLGEADSAFDSPQGLIANGRSVYVADTGNHAIRRIDLEAGKVSTLAGTGSRGGVLSRAMPGQEMALASVWDLALRQRSLYFANAGTHQLGILDLDDGIVRPCAGTGQEDLIDGAPASACLAQPSSLAFDAGATALYFLDSEASALRRLDLGAGGRVMTLVGAGLFEFGHANGDLAAARFQHCMGLDWWDGRLVVADSYNGVLRVVDPGRGEVSDLGEREFVSADGASTCSDPCGVAVAGPDRLLVADTNNHRLVELSTSRRTARTWA